MSFSQVAGRRRKHRSSKHKKHYKSTRKGMRRKTARRAYLLLGGAVHEPAMGAPAMASVDGSEVKGDISEPGVASSHDSSHDSSHGSAQAAGRRRRRKSRKHRSRRHRKSKKCGGNSMKYGGKRRRKSKHRRRKHRKSTRKGMRRKTARRAYMH